MKQSFSTRLLLMMLVCGLLISFAGCNQNEEPSSSSEESSSSSEESSSEPEEEIIENALERPTLMEKLNAGVERNDDTVGWLYLPNTTIDDAVLQSTDNDYYLRLTEDKVYDIYGCYFMDWESKQGTSAQMSKQNIIYGHSDLRDNPDGKDFSQIFKYLDIDFLRENPYIYYGTRGEDMVWQIFAVLKTNVDPKNANSFYYLDADPPSQQFLAMIDEAKLRSEYILDVPVTATDKILTLSTCLQRNNYRLVVMAKLLPATKQLAPLAEVEPNPNIKVS